MSVNTLSFLTEDLLQKLWLYTLKKMKRLNYSNVFSYTDLLWYGVFQALSTICWNILPDPSMKWRPQSWGQESFNEQWWIQHYNTAETKRTTEKCVCMYVCMSNVRAADNSVGPQSIRCVCVYKIKYKIKLCPKQIFFPLTLMWFIQYKCKYNQECSIHSHCRFKSNPSIHLL